MNVNSPPGGICYGYDSFYNAVNPIDGIYCVKCCKGIAGCRIDLGGKGCSVMAPGDYSSTFDGGIAPPKTGRTLASNGTDVTKEATPDETPKAPAKPSNAFSLQSILHLAMSLIILIL